MTIPPGLDTDDLNGEPEMAPGAQHGENHTRRPERDFEPKDQGARTRARNREIAQGRPFRG